MQALGLTMEALVTGLGHFLLPWACERAGYLKVIAAGNNRGRDGSGYVRPLERGHASGACPSWETPAMQPVCQRYNGGALQQQQTCEQDGTEGGRGERQ